MEMNRSKRGKEGLRGHGVEKIEEEADKKRRGMGGLMEGKRGEEEEIVE